MKKVIYDHWKIFLGFILTAFGIGFFHSIRDALVLFIEWRYSGWVVAIVIVAIVAAVALYGKATKRTGASIAFISGPPNHKKGEFTEPIKMYGVNWKFWLGSDSLFAPMHGSEEDSLRGWVDGPFCVVCDYKLDRDYKKHQWTCARCHTKIKIPNELRDDTRDKVIKILEADYRRQRKEDKA